MVKVSEYIVQYNNSLCIFQHRPTDKEHHSFGADIGLFLIKLTHDLWLGKVDCYYASYDIAGSIKKDYTVTAEIVGKHSFYWDYSVPITFDLDRLVNSKKSKGYNELFEEFFRQPKKYFKIL